MDRILVGVDGSPAAHDALAWSVNVSNRANLELVAARVFVATQAELPPEQYEGLHDDQRQQLEEWCESIHSAPTRRRSLLVDGEPPDALLAAARAEHADLLVVGGRGTGGFLHLHLGSVAHHLTHHTTVPLAIVPRSGAAPIEHIVTGLDGSPDSVAAAELCAELAERLDVAVTVVYAPESLAEWVSDTDAGDWQSQAETDVRSWSAPIEKAGVVFDVDVDRDCHPVAAIARALDAHPNAVAVVGTRGLGGFSGLRLGRIPLQLVHHTGAAVLLVPYPRSTL